MTFRDQKPLNVSKMPYREIEKLPKYEDATVSKSQRFKFTEPEIKPESDCSSIN